MTIKKRLTLGVLALSALPAAALADPTGSQGFADIGDPTANGSWTGNIETATAFVIGDAVSATSDTGLFAGMPMQTFGAVSFNSTMPTSLPVRRVNAQPAAESMSVMLILTALVCTGAILCTILLDLVTAAGASDALIAFPP